MDKKVKYAVLTKSNFASCIFPPGILHVLVGSSSFEALLQELLLGPVGKNEDNLEEESR